MRHKTYDDRLKCLRLWTLEDRRNRQDLIEVFKMYRGYSSVALQELFVLILIVVSKGTKGHSCVLIKARCARDIAGYFSNKVINTWNALEQSAVHGCITQHQCL